MLVRLGVPGVPSQPALARGLLTHAAAGGSATACAALSEMWRSGEGGAASSAKAYAWAAAASAAAEGGTPDLSQLMPLEDEEEERSVDG